MCLPVSTPSSISTRTVHFIFSYYYHGCQVASLFIYNIFDPTRWRAPSSAQTIGIHILINKLNVSKLHMNLSSQIRFSFQKRFRKSSDICDIFLRSRIGSKVPL